MIDRDNFIIHTIKRHFNEMNATLERINDSYDEFIEDLPMRKAIYLDILQIGENFNHLSDEILKKIDKKDIRGIIGVRNFIAHGYSELDNKQIWDIAHVEIPNLIKKLI